MTDDSSFLEKLERRIYQIAVVHELLLSRV